MSDVELVEAGEAFTHVAVRGKLDAAGVGAVELTLTSQTVARRTPAIVDLGAVDFIGSLGVGLLVSIARSLRGHGSPMAVIASGPVRAVLDGMTVTSLFPVVQGREEALRALGVE